MDGYGNTRIVSCCDFVNPDYIIDCKLPISTCYIKKKENYDGKEKSEE